jgi:hypothetical protein
MKNIYLLPTEKASRLGYLTKKGKEVFNDLRLFDTLMPNILDSENQHIYITDNSDIKDCWVLNIHINELYFLKGYYGIQPIAKKIILTTDPYLISDGIQAIDDEFLEWFVKNPSCEYVEVEIKPMFPMYSTFIESIDNPPFYGNLERRIIIPQEEPKQETLEEAALNYSIYNEQANKAIQEAVKFGAKWMKERMYSEEEFLEFSEWVSHNDWVYLPSKGYWVNEEQEELEQKLSSKEILNLWFEQFKKK